MKGIKPNLEAMKAQLEANKERAKRKEKVSINDNPILKVKGPGVYKFRATYYPHSEDPAATPFPLRHYHFGIPGNYTFYCPKMNDGESCAICDFVWSQVMDAKNGPGTEKERKKKVRAWADKLPKAKLWIPGKLRDREDEGIKMFSIGTAEDKMSKNHKKIFKWFFEEDTQDWLSPEKGPSGGFDIEIEYEEYTDGRQQELRASFGLKDIVLARRSTPFGDDFEELMEEVPNIDQNDLPILKFYTSKTSDEATEVLEKWQERLQRKTQSSKFFKEEKELDTSSSEDEPDDDSEKSGKDVSSLQERLKQAGYSVNV